MGICKVAEIEEYTQNSRNQDLKFCRKLSSIDHWLPFRIVGNGKSLEDLEKRVVLDCPCTNLELLKTFEIYRLDPLATASFLAKP